MGSVALGQPWRLLSLDVSCGHIIFCSSNPTLDSRLCHQEMVHVSDPANVGVPQNGAFITKGFLT